MRYYRRKAHMDPIEAELQAILYQERRRDEENNLGTSTRDRIRATL
jgi:hypothetical protein